MPVDWKAIGEKAGEIALDIASEAAAIGMEASGIPALAAFGDAVRDVDDVVFDMLRASTEEERVGIMTDHVTLVVQSIPGIAGNRKLEKAYARVLKHIIWSSYNEARPKPEPRKRRRPKRDGVRGKAIERIVATTTKPGPATEDALRKVRALEVLPVVRRPVIVEPDPPALVEGNPHSKVTVEPDLTTDETPVPDLPDDAVEPAPDPTPDGMLGGLNPAGAT